MVLKNAALLCLGSAALSAANHRVAAPSQRLTYTTAADRWDEALPLGNGILGALVWGNGQPLRISIDRADLWDLRPVPEFHSAETSRTSAFSAAC